MDRKERPKRGRPKATVNFPNGKFTFKELASTNRACDSLLRRRVREAVRNGSLNRVATVQTARTGRPETVYNSAEKDQSPACNVRPTEEEVAETVRTAQEWVTNQQESTGTSTPLN